MERARLSAGLLQTVRQHFARQCRTFLKMRPMKSAFFASFVMPGLVPGIHVFASIG
jgi:hypothetical protein